MHDNSLYKNILNIVKLIQIWIEISIFPIDLVPTEIPFGAKSTGKVYLQSDKIKKAISLYAFPSLHSKLEFFFSSSNFFFSSVFWEANASRPNGEAFKDPLKSLCTTFLRYTAVLRGSHQPVPHDADRR